MSKKAFKKRILNRVSVGKKQKIRFSNKKTEKFPHFRYYKPSKHPALIVAEHSSDEYKYRKVMHGEKDGKRTNEKVFPNPNPKDAAPMYIGKRVRHNKKIRFESFVLPWIYPDKKEK